MFPSPRLHLLIADCSTRLGTPVSFNSACLEWEFSLCPSERLSALSDLAPQWCVALQRIPGGCVCIKESQTQAVIITLPFDAPNLIDLILIGLFHLGFPAFKDASTCLSTGRL